MTNVNVSAQWTDGINAGSGNYSVTAAGTGIEDGTLAFDTIDVIGQLDETGSFEVSLRASDDFSPGVLVYSWEIRVQGIENIDAADIPLNAANGLSQGLFEVLTRANWSPGTPAE
jgi:hypothetical protein